MFKHLDDTPSTLLGLDASVTGRYWPFHIQTSFLNDVVDKVSVKFAPCYI